MGVNVYYPQFQVYSYVVYLVFMFFYLIFNIVSLKRIKKKTSLEKFLIMPLIITIAGLPLAYLIIRIWYLYTQK